MRKSDLTGKGIQFGNNVSASQRHTKRIWKPNLQLKKVIVDGKKVTLKLSAQDIRTLRKKNLIEKAK